MDTTSFLARSCPESPGLLLHGDVIERTDATRLVGGCIGRTFEQHDLQTFQMTNDQVKGSLLGQESVSRFGYDSEAFHVMYSDEQVSSCEVLW